MRVHAATLTATGLGALLTPLASAQGYQCPLTMPEDLTALEFAYGVQDWLNKFYDANGQYSASDFTSFPNSSMTQSNGQTLAANLATNMAGLTQQAQLGVEALTQLAGGMNLSPSCGSNFTYPPGLRQGTAMDFLTSSFFIEATLCGTFIGLADYVQNPAAAFLMARLSAEHGIHASYLASYMNPTFFSANSVSLTAAFTPEHVLQVGDGTASKSNVGHLGRWIPTGCLAVPQAPCGVNVTIGNLTASLSGGATSAYTYPLSSATKTMSGSAVTEGVYMATMASGGVTIQTNIPVSGGTYTIKTNTGTAVTNANPTGTTAYESGSGVAYPNGPTVISSYGYASGYAAASSTAYGNAGNATQTAAATSYTGPVVTSPNAAAGNSVSVVAAGLGMLLAALM